AGESRVDWRPPPGSVHAGLQAAWCNSKLCHSGAERTKIGMGQNELDFSLPKVASAVVSPTRYRRPIDRPVPWGMLPDRSPDHARRGQIRWSRCLSYLKD